MSEPPTEGAAPQPAAPPSRAAAGVDPAYVAVLALCALGLAAIAVHYLGAGR